MLANPLPIRRKDQSVCKGLWPQDAYRCIDQRCIHTESCSTCHDAMHAHSYQNSCNRSLPPCPPSLSSAIFKLYMRVFAWSCLMPSFALLQGFYTYWDTWAPSPVPVDAASKPRTQVHVLQPCALPIWQKAHDGGRRALFLRTCPGVTAPFPSYSSSSHVRLPGTLFGAPRSTHTDLQRSVILVMPGCDVWAG